jgi:hypothetical protein
MIRKDDVPVGYRRSNDVTAAESANIPRMLPHK